MAPRSIGFREWGGSHKLTLADDPSYDNIVVPGIPNSSMRWGTIPASEILNTDNHIFVEHGESTIYRAGFISSPANIGIIDKDQIVPLGMLETARIIAHRNKILRDSGINLPVPIATDDETETACLTRLLSAANANPGKGYQYYYPAASYAYAYEPTVKSWETLSPKFKAHKWFLPAPGDMMRFGQAYNAGWFDGLKPYSLPSPLDIVYTSAQYDSSGAFLISNKTGQIGQFNSGSEGDKGNKRQFFPMVQF